MKLWGTPAETEQSNTLPDLQTEVYAGYVKQQLDWRQYQDVPGPVIHRVYPSDDEAIDPRTETRPDWT